LVAMTDSSVEVPDATQVHQIGTAAIIHRIMESDDGTLTVFIQGLERFRVLEWTAEEPYIRARIEVSPDVVEESIVEEALRRNHGSRVRTASELGISRNTLWRKMRRLGL